MSTRGGPEPTATSEPGVEAAPARAHVGHPDAGHLDLDAECLEDPVHCGDARHQHDVHAAAAGGGTQPA
jgi:hypothetical protein